MDFGGSGDWLSGLFGGGKTAAVSSDASERQHLQDLGQPGVPSDVTMEAPTDSMAPAEQQILFPRGLPDAAHAGGLAGLAMRSEPPPPAPPPGSVAAGQPGGGVGNWLMTDPEGMAKAVRAQKQSAAISQTAGDAGSIVRMIAMAGA